MKAMECPRYSWGESKKIRISKPLAAAIRAWIKREESATGGTSAHSRFQRGTGASCLVDNELRLFRGQWTQLRLEKVARFVGAA
jgi:hypothetical protein